MKPVTGTTEVSIGEYCRLLRKREGMSLSQLAERSGLHRNTICRIENDAENTTIDTLQKLFGVFGLAIDVHFTEKTK